MKELKGKILLAYIAGIIDGEGSISLHIRREHGYKTCGLTICVANTNEWLINLLKIQFTGHIYFRESFIPKHKDAWQWTITGKKAAEFIKLIIPYLQIKRHQAELALQFQSRKRLGRASKENWQTTKILEEADRILMASYNKRGK